ncbi:MAG: TraR/DksA family transcriptional regulator [Nitrospinales bacterium]
MRKTSTLKKGRKPAKKAVKKSAKKSVQKPAGKAVKKTVRKTKTKKTAAKIKPRKLSRPQKSVARQKAAPPKDTGKQEKALNPTLRKIRDRLIREHKELLKILQTSKEMERNISELNFSNEIDLAASLEGREMIFTLSSRDRNVLKLIEDALFKISEGSYGICDSCSKPISLKRLQIMPLTAYCIDCQESMERT